ncbi:hypothetical protein [Piscirickettsia litoralis]|uniref:Uncharacterized protein n=1 Tax=Piscirickettsia litoralis TaxID=1891921 RepID=A0ABX3A4V4_9GAMM|nr:hypothetical protein [Piscirickettsia litoralis]ODN42460.1 hypothetical protein BGC07_05345 [Piscirickettsia litoralis]
MLDKKEIDFYDFYNKTIEISRLIDNPVLLPDGHSLNKKIDRLYRNKLYRVKTLYTIYHHIITEFDYFNDQDDETEGGRGKWLHYWR